MVAESGFKFPFYAAKLREYFLFTPLAFLILQNAFVYLEWCSSSQQNGVIFHRRNVLICSYRPSNGLCTSANQGTLNCWITHICISSQYWSPKAEARPLHQILGCLSPVLVDMDKAIEKLISGLSLGIRRGAGVSDFEKVICSSQDYTKL